MSFIGDDSTYDIQQQDLRRIMAMHSAMTFDEWNDKHGIVALPDSISSEQVWNAAKRDVWDTVFQVVSDNPQVATREFIKKLETARRADGCGPR